MRAMTPETKFDVKRRFNSTNTAIKALRAEQKAAKEKYGPVAKRGLYGKIDFWNRLIDLPIDSVDAPLLLTGYEPDTLRGNPNYKPSGTLGTAADYAAYKDKLAERREKIRQKMLLLTDKEKNWYRQRARLWSKGRKRARDAIKAYKAQLEADVNPIQLARYNPTKTLAKMYSDGFDAEIAADPDFYKDEDLKEDMTAEMGNAVHLPWFKQAYRKYAKGKRFAKDIPGREKYAPLTLGNRTQPYKLSQLTHSTVVNPNRILTQKMREAGKTLADVHYYIPRNKAEYDAKQAQKAAERAAREKASKAAAAQKANADLTSNSQEDDSMMFDVEDFDDDNFMHDAAATIYPSKTGQSSSSSTSSSISPTQVERIPQNRDGNGIIYDQFGEAMTIGEPADDIPANDWGYGWY